MNDFKLGQTITCIAPVGPLVMGNNYIIQGMTYTPCCHTPTIDVGFTTTAELTQCTLCGGHYQINDIRMFRASRFKAPQEQFNVIKLTESLQLSES